jgi:hypothetical protein
MVCALHTSVKMARRIPERSMAERREEEVRQAAGYIKHRTFLNCAVSGAVSLDELQGH